MSHAERYLELGLRLGRHVDGVVDSYCGPAELEAQVAAEELVPAAELAADALALRDELPDGWLRDQVHGCLTYARMLAGEEISYGDEVEGCYGVRPERTPESAYEDAHAALDELLPGDGPLLERREAWRRRQLCPGDRAVAVVEELLPLLRASAAAVVDLPDGERVTLDSTTGEPWWAFNYYQGDLWSRVVLNADVPTTGGDLVRLVAHEVYPGHHTEHVLKEQLLLRAAGKLEEGIQLIPTPQALLSEGIAELGLEIAVGDRTREQAYAVVRRHGIEMPDPELDRRIAQAARPLGTVGLNVALLIHEDGLSADAAAGYVARWSLRPLEDARRLVSFATDPTWRAYAITYCAGEDLCRAYVRGDPARFRTLLTEHVRVRDLLQSAA